MKFIPRMLVVGLLFAAAVSHASAATITVTGGSAAAVTNALFNSNPGDIIQIGDNLTYDFSVILDAGVPVNVANRTLRAAPGATPTIFANPPTFVNLYSVFRLSGNSTNPGTIEGLRFETGPRGQLISYVSINNSQYVTVRNNDFTIQNMENNFGSGRPIDIVGSGARGPTILIEGNLFYASATADNGRYAMAGVYTSGGAGGFLARNNILDMTGRNNAAAFGFILFNEGGATLTTIINNTLLFAPSVESYGVDLGTGNPLLNAFIQNNIFVNADYAYRDQNTTPTVHGAFSTLTLNYNLFDGLSGAYLAQPEDVITTNNNYTGVGIAQLDSNYQPAYGSLAMNNGLNGLNYGAVDFYGDQRVRFGIVDIGAVEIPEPSALALLAATGLWLWRRARRNG